MKKQRMNSVQENYIVAKVAWQAVKEVQAEKYNEFMQVKGLTEDDVNDENLESLSTEYEIFAKAEIENCGLAWNNYKLAEQAVLEAVIALYPIDWHERVRDGLLTLKTKESFIDLYLKTDIGAMAYIKAALLKRLAA